MRPTLIFILLVLLLLPHHHSAKAQQRSFPFSGSNETRTAPMITRSGLGPLVASCAQRRHGRHVLTIARSTNDGETWTYIDSVVILYSALFGLQRRPTVVETPSGTLVASFEDVRPGDQSPRVYSMRSTDNGQTWSLPLPIAMTAETAMEDFTSMACSPSGVALVAYISHDASEQGTHVMLQRSTDDGLTWLPPVRVTGAPWIGRACECCMTSITVGASGLVAVAFRANINNVRDVYVAFSFDNGQSFQTPLRVQNAPWTIEGCPATGPDVVIDDSNRAHVAWRDFRDGAVRPVIYYAQVSPSTASLVENIDLSTDVSDVVDYPTLCTDRLGSRAIIAYESGKGLVVRHVTNNTPSAPSIIDERATRDVGARLTASKSGRPALLWRTPETESYAIAFSIVDNTSSVVRDASSTTDEVTLDVDLLGRTVSRDYRGIILRHTVSPKRGYRATTMFVR